MQNAYQHACERAELLGMPTPSEAEWLASEECAREREAVEAEERDDAIAKELDTNDESMKHIGGGLDELNTILNATQKKINKFKNVCGSLGTLLKARVSSSPGTPEHKASGSSDQQAPTNLDLHYEDEQAAQSPSEDVTSSEQTSGGSGATPRKAELNTKVGSHLDKLESLISKAENAQYSMQQQTKQMRSFLK
ncbi:hypothetical protein QAD02_018690 [Eretmocerus hayati]|uniref:Uncharacterized protein n=1 Tax=Eretmocerus hayati TaxID=131215 RepID=A0ACC2PHF7_9HYME|nr:hypothetical protein QAD02_018690 [Eretmocerus hayati]